MAISIPHPMRWIPALLTNSKQRQATRYQLRFQLPWHPERWMVADDAVNVEGLMRAWSGPSYPDPESAQRARDAMQILYVPHRAAEYYRWSYRSILRTDGRKFRASMRRPITAPTLHIQGALDGCVLPSTAAGSGRYVEGPYEWQLIEGVGHFPHREARDLVTTEILRWCAAAGDSGGESA